MRKYCLRRWRGNGQIIPDIVKDRYHDYPKRSMNRRARVISLAESIVKIITEEEYLRDVLEIWGVEIHNKKVRQLKLGEEKLIKVGKDEIPLG